MNLKKIFDMCMNLQKHIKEPGRERQGSKREESPPPQLNRAWGDGRK